MTDIQRTLELTEEAVDMVLSGTQGLALGLFDTQRARLSPWDVARLDHHMRQVHRTVALNNLRTKRRGVVARILGVKFPDPEQAIAGDPRIALLFLHSHDGRLRETAVRSMSVEDADAAAHTALLLRCNDWVPQVREAAIARLRDHAPRLSQAALARLVVFGLARVDIWQRGGSEALTELKDCPLWLSAMEDAFATQADGPLVHVFKRQILEGRLDHALPRLARSARSAFVRSTAAECVLTERVRWKSGYKRQWVNRPLDISRRVPIFEDRTLEIEPEDCAAVVRSGARDTSAMVRKKVADTFIRDGGKDFSEEVTLLSEDPAASVRSRMEFFHRKFLNINNKELEND